MTAKTSKNKDDERPERDEAGNPADLAPMTTKDYGTSAAEQANKNARDQVDELNAQTEKDREAERGAATVNTDAPATRDRA